MAHSLLASPVAAGLALGIAAHVVFWGIAVGLGAGAIAATASAIGIGGAGGIFYFMTQRGRSRGSTCR